MIRFLHKLPQECIIACSGGVDSMAVLSFLVAGKKKVTAAYFDHGTEFGSRSFDFVSSYCKDNNINFVSSKISQKKNKDQSWEEYWRDERYKFLHSFSEPVITAHNLNDQMENWLFTSFHGNPRLIPYKNKNIIRPFLLTLKSEFYSWCKNKNIPFLEDPSNNDILFMRNKIRHDILPEVLKVNPGFSKVIIKKVLQL